MTDVSEPSRLSIPSASAFVGRRAEMSLLQAALHEAMAGHGQVRLVGGAAGIGKTRLVDEIAAYAGARGALVLTGCADEAPMAPYQLWVRAIRFSSLAAAAAVCRPGNR